MAKIGILALQGDVAEHSACLAQAAKETGVEIEIAHVRTAGDLAGLDGLVLPGGESTTMWKLLGRHDMLEGIRKIRCIFGTCAGLILMAKDVGGKIEGQESLGLLDCSVERNAYGPQTESFEDEIKTWDGTARAAFIRAPIIKSAGSAKPIAWHGKQAVGVESETPLSYYLGLSCHPEIAMETLFHRKFIAKCIEKMAKKKQSG